MQIDKQSLEDSYITGFSRHDGNIRIAFDEYYVGEISHEVRLILNKGRYLIDGVESSSRPDQPSRKGRLLEMHLGNTTLHLLVVWLGPDGDDIQSLAYDFSFDTYDWAVQ